MIAIRYKKHGMVFFFKSFMDFGRSTESHGEIHCMPEMKNDDVTFTKNQMARADIHCFHIFMAY